MIYFIFIIVFIFSMVILANSKNKSSDISDKEYIEQRRNEAIEYFKNQKEYKDKLSKVIDRLDEQYGTENIIECCVAGIFFRTKTAKEEVIDYMEAGSDVYLKLQPQNKYDKYAVKVMFNDKHIGFIPKTHSKRVHDQIRYDFGYIAVVKSLEVSLSDNIETIVIRLYPKTE